MSYSRAKNDFLIRIVHMLPIPLAKTELLPTLRDDYPELHVGARAYVCAEQTHDEIIDTVRALSDDDVIAILAPRIADAIATEQPAMTQTQADEIMTLVRKIDPTDSNAAALVRDAIRDNIDNVRV